MVKKFLYLWSFVKILWDRKPIVLILLLAIIPRLFAVVLSKGYGMHDDHFGPIEQPFQIMHDITYWTSRCEPHGHSIVYPAIHYALFNGLEFIGIKDPQNKMYIVRFLHAIYSLLIVYFGFKIAKKLSDENIAKTTGLVLALFWAFPFLSVRNLIEVVCIPPLMAGFFYVISDEEKLRNSLIAGLWFGLAFVFRYQTLAITGILGLILLLRKEFKQALLLGCGFLLTAFLIQGSADILAWGYPFASFMEYVRYNATHGYDYTTGPWYNYALLVLGALIPPFSFCLVYGLFRNWKKTLLILLPVLVFFVMHSYFPNKQERFIFPVVPLILMLGVIGWEDCVRKSDYWLRHIKLQKTLWVWFWVINFVLLVPFTGYYTKKARVEAMYTLYGKDVKGIVLVGGKWGIVQPPLFYANVYPVPVYQLQIDDRLGVVGEQIRSAELKPNYAVFFGPEDIQDRVTRVEQALGCKLVLLREIQPSFLDDVFYRLNPKYNKNQTTFVYEIRYNSIT